MDAANRLKLLVAELSKFYEQRFHETALLDPATLGITFNEHTQLDDREVDAIYGKYIVKLSEGLDGVLARLRVRLEPGLPGPESTSSCETLAGGVRFLGWTLQVYDSQTNVAVGLIHWGLYHRHDAFAVPGPAQVAFVKAAPGRTIMVG